MKRVIITFNEENEYKIGLLERYLDINKLDYYIEDNAH